MGDLNRKRQIKFIINLLVSILWFIFSYILSKPWLLDLSEVTGSFLAYVIIAGIAYIPGFMNTFLVCSLFLEDRTKKEIKYPKENITVLVAAYNEEKGILQTLENINNQKYDGKINVIVIDNNSTDNTVEIINNNKDNFDIDIMVISEKKQGKFNALNTGLIHVKTKYVVTIDADTVICTESINHLVTKMLSGGDNTAAVAGSMLVLNPEDSLITRMQLWDYTLSIASIKRMQSLYNSTMVAQGAFSIYTTKDVIDVGGWSDAIGEDIVLTWKMLHNGKDVLFEPLAIAFTDTPTTLSHFIKQRARWARGMIEGLREIKPWEFKSNYAKLMTTIDVFIIFIDFSFTFFWIPGLILAIVFSKYYIVGLMSLLVLPITVFSFYTLYRFQKKDVLDVIDVDVKGDIIGFMLFILTYQVLMSPTSLYGYIQEWLGLDRVWK